MQTKVSQAARNNCYSLLHQLLNEEKDASLLRFIKRENFEVQDLIKRVAAASRSGAERLEAFAKRDRSLRLNEYRLPPGEKMTREDIGSQKEHELLHESGTEFEITLLLTQIEAVNYAAHLAKVAGENDLQPDRARYLAELSNQMEQLHKELVFCVALNNRIAADEKPK